MRHHRLFIASKFEKYYGATKELGGVTMKFELPDLPYAEDALEPVISAEIMNLHHKKHHQTYVKNLNDAFEKSQQAASSGDLDTVIALQSAIKFNGGGHINHSLFWENLAPKEQGGGEPPTGPLEQMIKECFGSLDQFIEKFNSKAAPIQGSGWCWLVACKGSKRLCIVPCPNQDPLFATTGYTPLLGVDVWEHAYYLQYKNVRPDYLKNIWQVINWKVVENRYKAV